MFIMWKTHVCRIIGSFLWPTQMAAASESGSAGHFFCRTVNQMNVWSRRQICSFLFPNWIQICFPSRSLYDDKPRAWAARAERLKHSVDARAVLGSLKTLTKGSQQTATLWSTSNHNISEPSPARFPGSSVTLFRFAAVENGLKVHSQTSLSSTVIVTHTHIHKPWCCATVQLNIYVVLH